MSVAAVCLSIIGLQAVGQNLSDPFGGDRVDFPVMSFINDTLAGTRKLVHRPEAQPLSISIETEMHDEAYSKMNSKGYRIFRKDVVNLTTDQSGNSEVNEAPSNPSVVARDLMRRFKRENARHSEAAPCGA